MWWQGLLSRLLRIPRAARRLAGGPEAAPFRVTPADVRWAFRLLLDRDLDDRGELAAWAAATASLADLRQAIMLSKEFQVRNAGFAAQLPAEKAPFRVSPRDVRWAFRLLLDRDLDDPEALATWTAATATLADLRREIMLSEEFQVRHAGFVAQLPPEKPPFRVSALAVRWAFRLLLDLDLDDPEKLAAWVASTPTFPDLRRTLLLSDDFKERNAGFAPRLPQRLIALVEIGSGMRLYVDLADAVIGRHVLAGTYEPAETSWLLAQVQPGDLVLDIGANIGYFTLLLATRVGPGGRVIAYEPCPANADLLERSLQENRLADRVVLHRAAVAEVAGESELAWLPPEQATNSGGAFLVSSGATPPPAHQATRVPVVALDQEDLRGRVALIKIDVEGAEPLALKGAARLLARDRPKILAELNPPALRRSGTQPSGFLSLMAGLGYAAHHLQPGGALEPLAEAGADDRICSVVFLPAPSPGGTQPGSPSAPPAAPAAP